MVVITGLAFISHSFSNSTAEWGPFMFCTFTTIKVINAHYSVPPCQVHNENLSTWKQNIIASSLLCRLIAMTDINNVLFTCQKHQKPLQLWANLQGCITVPRTKAFIINWLLGALSLFTQIKWQWISRRSFNPVLICKKKKKKYNRQKGFLLIWLLK